MQIYLQIWYLFILRVVECGGGKVIIVKTPIKDADSLATQLTHALADPTYEAEVMKTLSVRGIPCVMPDYIAEHLFEVSISKN